MRAFPDRGLRFRLAATGRATYLIRDGLVPRPSRPSAALDDLRRFLGAGDHRHRLLFGVLALLLPVLIVLGFQHDAQPGPQPPTLTFVESWPANRTDAQIVAQQKIDSAARAKAFEARRRSYERLAKMLGLE